MPIERLHRDVWKKFIRMPYGHVIDYVGDNGEIIYPTPEECEKGIPNGMGWWTPIENGAFFTGLYAYTLIKRYDVTHEAELLKEIEVLMNGLYVLQDVARNEGFIARGVAEDGHSHYPISSDDQFMPWMLAVWAYYNSGACRNKEEAKARLLKTLTVLRDNNYSVITDWDGVCLGSWRRQIGWRDVSKLVFVAALIARITESDADHEEFIKISTAIPDGTVFTRLEIVSHGFAQEMINSYGKQPWICTSTHIALHELLAIDPQNADYYNRAIYNNSVATLPMIKGFSDFKGGVYKFDIDWRVLNAMWEDHGKLAAPNYKMAFQQNDYWMDEVVPARKEEHVVLGNAVYGAWIAILSNDKRISEEAYKRLIDGYSRIEWEKLHLPMAYAAECAFTFYEIIKKP